MVTAVVDAMRILLSRARIRDNNALERLPVNVPLLTADPTDTDTVDDDPADTWSLATAGVTPAPGALLALPRDRMMF